MALPSDKKFTGSSIFYPTKIHFIRYHQLFCGKLEAAVHSCFVEQLFSRLLKISKKNRWWGSILVNFFSLLLW